jgi:hypothetical protein
MKELIATSPLIYDPKYYVDGIIRSDLIEHGVDPLDEQIVCIESHVKAFLNDCLRMGLYFLYNFYGQWNHGGTCLPTVYRAWNYNFYLKKHYLVLSIEDYSTIKITKTDEGLDSEMRVCRILQKPPCLPHAEVIKICNLLEDSERPGLRPWHNADENYFLAVSYQISESYSPKIPENLGEYIMFNQTPFLYSFVNSLKKGK